MTDAHISIDQIVLSWLGKRGYPIHYYVKGLLLASEAVQELSLTSLPMIHHALLTKTTNQNWYTLPQGFTDYVRVGVRFGDTWYPLRISERLMPYTNSDGTGDMGSDLGTDLNTAGGHSSWYSGSVHQADFNPADFSTGFNTLAASTIAPPVPSFISNGWASYSGGYSRWGLGVSFDVARGVIVAPESFGFSEIYLVYTGIGTVDNMTGIPVIAQAAIEAYMDFKYAANKRDVSRGEAQDWERKYDIQHRLLRARIAKWSIEDVVAAFEDRFNRRTTDEYSASITTTNAGVTTTVSFGLPYTLPFALP